MMRKIILTFLALFTMASMAACGKKAETIEPETETQKAETIELFGKGIAGTETRYDDGTSDYQNAYTSHTGRILNISINGFENGLKPSDSERNCQFNYSSDNENIYFCSIGMVNENNKFPLQTASDEEILNAFPVDGTPDLPAFSREETENDYRLYRVSDREDAMPDKSGRQYSVLIHDKKSDALFHIMVLGVGEFSDDAVLRKLADNINVSLGEFSTEAETFFTEPGEYEFSAERIQGTEIVSENQKVDYEVLYDDPVIEEAIKINVSGTGFTIKPSYVFADGTGWCSFTLGTDAENLYELRVCASLPYTASSLKDVGVDGLARCFAGAADSSTFSKIETDDDYRIYFLLDLDPSTSTRKYTKQYSLYVERKDGVSYTVIAYANGISANDMLLRKYVDSVEVSLAE